MASTYSPKLRLELIGAGEQAGLWGTTTNKNIGQLIEQAIAGVTTVTLDGLSGNYTLTALDGAPDQSRSAVIKCSYSAVPAVGPVNIIIPTQTKLYVVRNDCGQTITVKTAAQVSGVQLLDGESSLVFCDGTNAIPGIQTASVGTLTVPGGGTGQTTFSAGFIKSPGGTAALTSASAVSLTADVSGTLPVANGGTGAASFTAGRMLIGNGSGQIAVLAGTAPNQIATWDGTQWTAVTPSATGVTSFNAGTTGFSPSVATSGVVTLSGTLNIANGGTGATTAANARTNLGVTATGQDTTYCYRANNLSDVNATSARTNLGVTATGQDTTYCYRANNLSDVNATSARTNLGLGSLATASSVSLTSQVSGTLPVGNGGTGVAASGAFGNVLKSNGSAWTSGTLTGYISYGAEQASEISACSGSDTLTDLKAPAGFVLTGVGVIFSGGSCGRMANYFRIYFKTISVTIS